MRSNCLGSGLREAGIEDKMARKNLRQCPATMQQGKEPT